MFRIDPATNAVTTIDVGQGPVSAAEAFGDIRIPSCLGTQVFRIRPPLHGPARADSRGRAPAALYDPPP